MTSLMRGSDHVDSRQPMPPVIVSMRSFSRPTQCLMYSQARSLCRLSGLMDHT